jgi:hypothetical protein
MSDYQQLDLRMIALGQEYKWYKFTVYGYGASEIIEILSIKRPTPMRVKNEFCRKHGNYHHYNELKVRSVNE